MWWVGVRPQPKCPWAVRCCRARARRNLFVRAPEREDALLRANTRCMRKKGAVQRKALAVWAVRARRVGAHAPAATRRPVGRATIMGMAARPIAGTGHSLACWCEPRGQALASG